MPELPRAEREARDDKALRLISTGHSYRQVVSECGYGSTSRAHAGVQRAIARTLTETSLDECKARMIVESRALSAHLWQDYLSPPQKHDRVGRPIVNSDGTPAIDAEARDRSARLIIASQDRLARLLGTDAPGRSITLTVESVLALPTDVLGAAVAELERRLSKQPAIMQGESARSADPYPGVGQVGNVAGTTVAVGETAATDGPESDAA